MRRRDVIVGIGGAIALPLAALAEQKPLPVIGWLSPMSAVAQGGNRMGESGKFPAGSAVGAFHEGLNEIGYVEGQNVAIEYRWADGRFDRLPALAADLVARNVDVIVTVAGNRPPGAGGKNSDVDDPDRLHQRCESSRGRLGGQFSATRGQSHWFHRRSQPSGA